MGRIILVAFALHPKWGSEAGRAARWLELMVQHHQVDVITASDARDELGGAVHKNATFHFIEGMQFWNKLGVITGLMNIAANVFFFKVKRLLRTLAVSDFDAIHCITPAGIYAHNDFYRFGVPIIVGPLGGGLRTPQGFGEAFRHQRLKTLFRDAYYWYVMRWSRGLRKYLSTARIVVVGMSVPRDFLPLEAQAKVHMIPDVLVDTDYFKPAPKTEKDKVTRVLFAGRLVSNKGPFLLLDAIRACLARGVDNFVVEFVGTGILRRELENAIIEYRIGNHAKVVGGLSKSAMRAKYQDSDIFCLPTLREPGGVAILEAMACGLPVITSNYGGPSVSVTHDCGIKINMTNYDAYVRDLAEALVRLIKNPDLRARMGAMGRQHAEGEYSVAALKRKIVDLYKAVVND